MNVDDDFYCSICQDVSPFDLGLTLECGHIYCRECIKGYIISKINENRIEPKCFSPMITASVSQKGVQICGTIISEPIIRKLLRDNVDVLSKYDRFLVLNNNPNARECPKCSAIKFGSISQLSMVCGACGTSYCFKHAGAHPGETCEVYLKKVRLENIASDELLVKISKECPGCGLHIEKSSGCNHMKCTHCDTAFCWLCGQEVEDDVFPVHYQWWNLTHGCVNMQMHTDVDPSVTTVRGARCLGILQCLLFGPISLVSSCASIVLCGWCCCLPSVYDRYNEMLMSSFSPEEEQGDGDQRIIPMIASMTGLPVPEVVGDEEEYEHINTRKPLHSGRFSRLLSSCLSLWGIVWMFLLGILPLVILSVFGGILLYPFYFVYRICTCQYPWPDYFTGLCCLCLLRDHYVNRSQPNNFDTGDSMLGGNVSYGRVNSSSGGCRDPKEDYQYNNLLSLIREDLSEEKIRDIEMVRQLEEGRGYRGKM